MSGRHSPTWPYRGCRHSGSGNRVQSR
jgi:hypothetical protein